MSELVRKVQAACAFGTPNVMITKEIVGEVVLLTEMREELRSFIAEYEAAPVSHRPMKSEIMAKLKEIAGG